MVLITVGNSEGERHCDARCYNATGPDCDCCCNGANHGKGLEAAQTWTAEHARKLLEDSGAHVEIQGNLFTGARP